MADEQGPDEEAPEPSDEERETAFWDRFGRELSDEGGALDRWIARHDAALTEEERKDGEAEDEKGAGRPNDREKGGGGEPDARAERELGRRGRGRGLLPFLYDQRD